MISRLALSFALLAPLCVPAQAVSPFEFLRRQQQREERRESPPPEAIPARPEREPARPEREPAAARPASPPGGTPNRAQDDAPTANPAAPTAAAAPPQNTAPPPYEKDMRRIGEILGALHYLRPLCGADDGPVWRDKMRQLIDAEGGPPDRRERLAGAFNEGYNGFQLTYRSCTPSADLAVRRYLAEGQKLTREIAARHGN